MKKAEEERNNAEKAAEVAKMRARSRSRSRGEMLGASQDADRSQSVKPRRKWREQWSRDMLRLGPGRDQSLEADGSTPADGGVWMSAVDGLQEQRREADDAARAAEACIKEDLSDKHTVLLYAE